jgi:hypothetical protein
MAIIPWFLAVWRQKYHRRAENQVNQPPDVPPALAAGWLFLGLGALTCRGRDGTNGARSFFLTI